MFMMMVKSMIQTQVMSGHGPKEALETVNQLICSNNREGMFISVWLGIVDVKHGTMVAANAGHEYPIVKKPGEKFEILKDEHGFVVGGLEGMKYKEYELKMEPGTKLFVYTDGVPEATDSHFELFGMDRTLAALNSAADADADDILCAVEQAVAVFVGKAEQFDDMTMLCFEYIGD
jgi:sigma-B regulation protein RsbU (phosphoserine phosphatase)